MRLAWRQAANELQKSLESANIKLQSVVTDIAGASSMEMLQELTSGRNNPRELAQLAKRRLRAKSPNWKKP
jgi:transposase